jgi:tetratricopeptide (TPR) repeat protein
MAKKAMRREPAAAAQRPGQPAERSAGLEHCRKRLQSVELLLGSSRRDGLVLARALLDDVVIMLAAVHLPEEARAGANLAAVMRALPGTRTRDHLIAAQRWLEDAQAPGSASTDGIVALRRVVTDLTQMGGRADTTGLTALRRITRLQASIGGAVLLAILVAALLMLGGQDRRAAQFDALLAEGNARLAASDHVGALERFRGAIAAMPGKDRTASAWNDMGWSLQQLGRPEEAIAAYRKALELKPAFPIARNNLEAAQRQLDLKKSEKERQGR